MKSIASALRIIILGLLSWGCSKTEPRITPDPGEPTNEWSPNALNDVRKLHIVPSLGFLTSGSTQYVSKLKFDNWLSVPNLTPDLGDIVPQKEAINLITVGGGLTAGAQSGGLFRDGQLSAYPNLVAKQLGMSDFKTPVFDEPHANGTGFTLVNEDKSQTFFRVDNNLGTVLEEVNGRPLQLSPYVGHVNNYSTPWLGTFQILYSTWEEKYIGKAVNGNGVSWQPFLPYAARFIPIDYFVNGTVLDYIIDNQPYNFFILEDTAEGFLNVLRLKGAREMSLNDLIYDIRYGENYTLTAIKNLKRNGSNGVIFTVPHFKNLGISSWDIKVLTNEETATYEKAVDVANQHILEWAKLNGLVVVDLDALYMRVKDGQVTIGKDIRVNGSFEGNFFSSDGVYPSTLGQAIVANEVIKAINSQFKSKIQPIDIERYLISIGAIR